MVLATGLPFETVVGFTQVQFVAVQKAIRRHWEMTASVNGIQAMFGTGLRKTTDDTAEFERRVKHARKVGGVPVDVFEVL